VQCNALRDKSATELSDVKRYAKPIARNLCGLVMQQCELGIEPIFWPGGSGGPRDVLPMAWGW
jgi:hypothetical protein